MYLSNTCYIMSEEIATCIIFLPSRSKTLRQSELRYTFTYSLLTSHPSLWKTNST